MNGRTQIDPEHMRKYAQGNMLPAQIAEHNRLKVAESAE